ncbi:ComEC/Rec2 family competence protein [Mucilaginibacter paludis]|uniref:ComEC/Rec2-related protein n=1 Tax=Mucilaginibacter paludis DSM 18603 TaxID=714943 RepID=H1YDE1_9SPHI|nr:ComEC/Rec2 family competence protein [Mucilaginibacter paludis]EHQ30150.1 ComEC/Rec2-related protein [Mucilaginibacter paludis DSM 18603]
MIAFNKAQVPFALLLLPFVAGLCLAMLYPFAAHLHLLQLALGAVALVFIGLNFAYQRLHIYKTKWMGGLIAFTLLLMAGIYSFEINRGINATDHFSKHPAKYLTGIINSEPKLNAGILRFIVKVKQSGDTVKLNPVSGNLLVSVKTDTSKKINLAYGDEVLFPVKFTPVDAPLNPAEFNYKAYLAHQNIYHQLFLIQHEITTLHHNSGNPMVANALKLRLYLVNKLRANMADTDAVAVASTIILGYRADLRKDVQQAYSKTGTMHLLSVAGMHVGLVYFLIVFILSLLPQHKHSKIIKAIIAIVLIWCYALITGFSPAVSRAALMLSMVITGSTFNRHIHKLNLLALSAFILLLYNPFYITDAGFQLSYLAVFGIIIIQPPIYRWLSFKNKYLREVWLVCSVSLSAQIILLPIGILYFHDFPVYFLASNIFIIIPSAIVMYAGILYLALPPIPWLSYGLGWLLDKTISIMTKTLALMEHAPFATINKLWLSPAEFILCYALIAGIFCFLTLRNKQWLKFSLVIGLALSISISLKTFRSSRTNALTFFSLRKNSGILFRTGNSAVLITDLKEQDKAYQYTIQPYLDSCQIGTVNQVDINLLTGHNGNLPPVKPIKFNGQRIVIFDRTLVAKKMAERLNTDYIYLTGNPQTNLQLLKQSYIFKLLIVGGSNSNRLNDQLEQEAMLLKVNYRNLKRNKSLTLVSNQ